MSTPRKIKTPLTEEIITSLHAGDMVLLSGEVYTARDVAYKRLYEALANGKKLPVALSWSYSAYMKQMVA
jgi:fumarate hydratase subunit beta